MEFIGFQIREDGFTPCAATVEAIRQFPRPQNITGLRAWFGLVDRGGKSRMFECYSHQKVNNLTENISRYQYNLM